MTRKRTRRYFLKRSTETTALIGAATALGTVHVWGQENPTSVRLGIIGCGGIMGHHVKGLVERNEKVSIGWLCDVDPAQIDRISKSMVGFQSKPAKRTSKFEDVLADPNVDAVIVATPHHWHAPIAINAMTEGKDVYLEKPISHVYDEGHAIIRAAKKYGRVVQQGSQMRNSPVTDRAGKLLADGLNIWSYDVDLAQVTVKPQKEALANTPALLLGGSEDALQQFNNDGSYIEAGTTWVKLSPKNTDSGFLRVELGFKRDQLYRMVFFDNLLQTTLVALHDVTVNVPFEPGEFVFNVPPDVDVVGTAAEAAATTP